ncbi:MobQ family relaxase [Moraxella bovis]|uniref:MobA n=2 Tax=Moraxella bovis TaxID=476 RepID=D0V0D2_MORBO|nr:MobQ family relaxase [Moraxella bovis]ACY24370.1 MobA [Moraxella bovis]OOR87703.1 hypothetical protein B0182_11520 [Moraxella bovis]
MAIYHLSIKPISRSSGRSAVASIAYRAGIEITDERLGKTYDYTKRSGILWTGLATPHGLNIDRNELWNRAEKTETRSNSRTAREIVINIPHELMQGDQSAGKMLAYEFATSLSQKYGIAVDVAVHAPDKQGDNRNYHAHLLLTTRQITQEQDGIFEFGKKSQLEMSNTQLKQAGLLSNQNELKEIRREWAELANEYLAEQGIDTRIDHRSHKDRGLETLPTVKMGWKATELERQGIRTEVGDQNRAIKAYNAQIGLKNGLKEQVKAEKLAKNEFRTPTTDHNTLKNAPRNAVEPQKIKNGMNHPPPKNTLKTQIMAFYDDYKKSEQELLATQPILDEYLAKCNERAKKLHAVETKQANNRQSSAWKTYETLNNNKPLLQDLRPKFMGKSQWELDKEQAYNEFWQAKQAFLDLYKQEPKKRHKQQAKEQIEQEYPELCKQASKHWLGLHKHEWQTKQYIEKIKLQVDEVAKGNTTYFGEIIAITELGILQETKQGVVYHNPKDVELNQNQVGKVLALEYPKVMFADKQLVEVKTQSQHEKQQSQLDKDLTKDKGRGFGD